MNDGQLKKITCWHKVTADIFQNEIVPLNQPAVLKGFVNNWPIVKASSLGVDHLYQYLLKHDAGGDVRLARLPAKERGLLFYNSSMSDFNFTREIAPLEAFLQEVLNNSQDATADTIAIQSAPMADYFPCFEQDNPMSLFNETISPRIWIGTNAVVNTHYDDSENIACVVSGKRKFTLFPPEQIENLYIGPMEFTPAGAPVSLVDLTQPDFKKYPKFKTALNHALEAELDPGDAIYIPTLWWHHVRALGGVNVLVNYWQGGSINGTDKPVPADNILMAMMSLRDLPQAQKDAWKAHFDYYIFSDQSKKHQHIPEKIRGILSPLNNVMKKQLKKWLKKQLK